jgi:hypothetical protein
MVEGVAANLTLAEARESAMIELGRPRDMGGGNERDHVAPGARKLVARECVKNTVGSLLLELLLNATARDGIGTNRGRHQRR